MKRISNNISKGIILVLLTPLLGACEKGNSRAEQGDAISQAQRIRSPAVAGTWYPSDADELRQLVERLLAETKSADIDGEIYALVSPHAGYPYSGSVAAAAFKQVQDRQFDAIVIIGPSHREYFSGVSVYNGDGYRTPLGVVTVDKELARAIVEQDKLIRFDEVGHRAEHSVEAEIPFVQTLFPDVGVVPIVMLDDSWDVCRRLAEAIVKAVGHHRVLLVASSDLYHGYSYEECKRTNDATLAKLVALEPQSFCEGLHRKEYSACGGGPITVVEQAAQKLGATRAQIVLRTNSGDVTGQKEGWIVGYAAAVIYGEEARANSSRTTSSQKHERIQYEPVDETVQKELLRIAREAIASYLNNGTIPEFKPKSEVMKEKRGVFVTLNEHGMLRGCIGHHESDVPLYKLVPEMAVAAAFRDPRFPQLKSSELEDIKIKISVYLSDVYKIESIDEFEMGRHGIIMYKNGHSATYLPEVPIEAGWKTKEEELRSLCRKAGLPSDAWKKGAEFYVYETQVFGETKD